MKTTYGLFIALALALGTFAGKADTIVNLNTGVDSSGAPLLPGAQDPRWTVTSPYTSATVPATVGGAPTYPYGWGSAQIITPTPAGNVGGYYTYEIQFSITKVAGLTYSLSAAAWADDSIRSVSFGNTGGPLTGLTLVPGAGTFATFLTSDQSLFENGPKTLRLTVFNDSFTGTGMALAGAVTAVPEASEWAMLIGAAGLGLLFYRKQLIALMQREAPAAA